jgi:hypothetical protein
MADTLVCLGFNDCERDRDRLHRVMKFYSAALRAVSNKRELAYPVLYGHVEADFGTLNGLLVALDGASSCVVLDYFWLPRVYYEARGVGCNGYGNLWISELVPAAFARYGPGKGNLTTIVLPVDKTGRMGQMLHNHGDRLLEHGLSFELVPWRDARSLHPLVVATDSLEEEIDFGSNTSHWVDAETPFVALFPRGSDWRAHLRGMKRSASERAAVADVLWRRVQQVERGEIPPGSGVFDAGGASGPAGGSAVRARAQAGAGACAGSCSSSCSLSYAAAEAHASSACPSRWEASSCSSSSSRCAASGVDGCGAAAPATTARAGAGARCTCEAAAGHSTGESPARVTRRAAAGGALSPSGFHASARSAGSSHRIGSSGSSVGHCVDSSDSGSSRIGSAPRKTQAGESSSRSCGAAGVGGSARSVAAGTGRSGRPVGCRRDLVDRETADAATAGAKDDDDDEVEVLGSDTETAAVTAATQTAADGSASAASTAGVALPPQIRRTRRGLAAAAVDAAAASAGPLRAAAACPARRTRAAAGLAGASTGGSESDSSAARSAVARAHASGSEPLLGGSPRRRLGLE